MPESIALSSRRVVASVLVLALLTPASIARAADSQSLDTVFLKGGGRVRGTVIEEDPQVGVTIQLPDGNTRKVPRKTIDRVDYAPGTAPSPAPAAAQPSVAPVAPVVPAPQPFRYPTYVPPPPATERRNPALMITGIILMPAGVLTMVGGGAFYHGTTTDGGVDQRGKNEISAGFHNGAGVLDLSTGVVLTIVGAHRRAPYADAATQAGTPRLTLGTSPSRVSVVAEGQGLALHFKHLARASADPDRQGRGSSPPARAGRARMKQ